VLVRAIILLMSAATWSLATADDQRAPTPPEPTEAEIRLAEGPFAALAGAALGAPRTFENDIDSTECFPVRASGRVLAWIHRAHRAASRLFVEPCEPYATTAIVSRGATYGGASQWWFEATLAGPASEPQLALRRLDLPGWNWLSNPSFCGERIAFWAFGREDGDAYPELRVRVADVTTGRVLAASSLGRAMIETDNRSCLARPVWNAGCRSVVFDATVHDRGSVRLDVR